MTPITSRPGIILPDMPETWEFTGEGGYFTSYDWIQVSPTEYRSFTDPIPYPFRLEGVGMGGTGITSSQSSLVLAVGNLWRNRVTGWMNLRWLGSTMGQSISGPLGIIIPLAGQRITATIESGSTPGAGAVEFLFSVRAIEQVFPRPPIPKEKKPPTTRTLAKPRLPSARLKPGAPECGKVMDEAMYALNKAIKTCGEDEVASQALKRLGIEIVAPQTI